MQKKLRNIIQMKKVLSCIISFAMIIGTLYLPHMDAGAAPLENTNFTNVVLFAYFDGSYYVPEGYTGEATTYLTDNLANFQKYYDGDSKVSFSNYISTVSGGKVRVKNVYPQVSNGVLTPYKITDMDIEYLKQANNDYSLIKKVASSVSNLDGITLDYDGDGYIDNVTLIVQCCNDSTISSSSSMVCHKGNLGANDIFWGKKINTYNILNTGSISQNESGVIAHEFLHSLGFPDLYRTDGSADRPVYIWDIMGAVSYSPSWPLAYLRKEIGGWLTDSDVPTVTGSATKLSLSLQSADSGKKAYIIKSPLSDEEYFVVEFRKKAYQTGNLDRFIGGDGLIIYRVDTRVEGYTNSGGQTGVYVFRPWEGQTGYSTIETTNVYNAAFSVENGRTYIGSADLSKGLSEGALTFADGTNSGIVISNISSSAGNEMTFDVTVPKAEDMKTWYDTGYQDKVSDTVSKSVAVETVGDKTYLTVLSNESLKTFSYDGSKYESVASDIIGLSDTNEVKLAVLDDELYALYNYGSSILRLSRLDSSGKKWVTVKDIITTTYSYSLKASSGKLAISYVDTDDGWPKGAAAAAYSKDGFTGAGMYYSGFSGKTEAITIGDDIYAAIIVNELVGSSYSNVIHVYKYSNGKFVDISFPKTVNAKNNTFSIISHNGIPYVLAASTSGEKLYRYENGSWNALTNVVISASDVLLKEYGGKLYIMYDSDSRLLVHEFVDSGSSLDTGLSSAGTKGMSADFTVYGNAIISANVKTTNGNSYSIVVKSSVKPDKIEKPGENSGGNTSGENPGGNTGGNTSGENQEVPSVTVSYRTHVQSYGWQSYVSNGTMSGTEGKAKRLEGINIKLSGNDKLGIQYVTHCQTYGWLSWSSNDEMNGTTGEAKRLEAIMIQLTGEDKDLYDVYYRVHAETYGWLDWAKNGEAAGTAGYAKRLEGIQIVVLKKGEAIDKNMGGIKSKQAKAYISKTGGTPVVKGAETPHVTYQTHVQSYGWQAWKYDGNVSGTTGEGKRLEGIKIKLTNKDYSGGICYTTHVQSYGWQNNVNDSSTWTKDGDISGTLGQAKRLEAIRINLYGEMASHYDIYYRTQVQSYGWMDWVKNGELSGTSGQGKRLEAIEIKLVPKQ